MPKVSIIIPFNNVENYIEQCLDSVLAQTLKDIEVILVNDASKDKSGEIAQRYAKNDARIKIIDIQEQKGQGFARNRAIEIATGEYIGFVDSDDFIEPNMFEELYQSAKLNDTDITMCQVREYDDINENYITTDYYSLDPLSSFGENVFKAEDTKEQILDINVALWNKIYKREYLNNIGEKFPEGFIYEDLPFFFGTYLPAQRINIVWKNLYIYRVNRKNSTMQQVNNKVLDRLPMVSLTYEKLKSVGFLSDLKQKIQGWIIDDLFHRYTLLKECFHKEYFFLMKKVFESLEIENVEDKYWKKVYHFEGYLLVMNNTFEDFSQKVFCEYLDIHKVESRILSKVLELDDADSRFNEVYDNLTENYKYTEHIVNVAESRIREDLNVDAKIARVYEEITRNYEYTKKLTDEVKEHFEHVIPAESELTKIKTDEKIKRVYEEITNNYEFTKGLHSELQEELAKSKESINKTCDKINEKTKDLYNDIKDLSFVCHDNYVELGKEQEKIRESFQKTVENVAKSTDVKINDVIASMNEKLDSVACLIEEQEKKNAIEISELVKKLEEEKKQAYELISEMKSEFVSTLKEEQLKHKEEMTELKQQISELEFNLREEMKSPLKKLLEKYTNKQEK